MKKLLAFVLLLFVVNISHSQQKDLFRDENAPMHDRIMDLLSKLTIE
jgi:beta-glucosidase